jgi:hypothetical protein
VTHQYAQKNDILLSLSSMDYDLLGIDEQPLDVFYEDIEKMNLYRPVSIACSFILSSRIDPSAKTIPTIVRFIRIEGIVFHVSVGAADSSLTLLVDNFVWN